MLELNDLLARAGLPLAERLLIRISAELWPGNWESLASCFSKAKQHGLSRKLVEETLLQAVLFCGFPRAISGFEALQKTWPAATPPSGGELPPTEQADAGNQLFQTIYGKNDTAVRKMLRSFHGELHDFVMQAAYARVLTRPAMPPQLRELIATGTLAVMQQAPQMVAHGRGAMNFGADSTALFETLVTATGNVPLSEILLRKITSRSPG